MNTSLKLKLKNTNNSLREWFINIIDSYLHKAVVNREMTNFIITTK